MWHYSEGSIRAEVYGHDLDHGGSIIKSPLAVKLMGHNYD